MRLLWWQQLLALFDLLAIVGLAGAILQRVFEYERRKPPVRCPAVFANMQCGEAVGHDGFHGCVNSFVWKDGTYGIADFTGLNLWKTEKVLEGKYDSTDQTEGVEKVEDSTVQ